MRRSPCTASRYRSMTRSSSSGSGPMPSADRKDLGVFYPFMGHACHVPVVEVDLETGLEIERQQFAALFATRDREIGMQSFVQNGPGRAEFEGR